MRRRSFDESPESINMECKPVAFMSLMLLSFWFMLSYFTNSYFVIFLIFSNFILLFACCVSLSGYVLRRYIDARQEQPGLVEVPTISSTTPYIIPDYPPTYEEATRNMAMSPRHILHGHVSVSACVVCASHRHLKEITRQQQRTQNTESNLISATTTTTTSNRQSNQIVSGRRSSVRSTASCPALPIDLPRSSSLSGPSSSSSRNSDSIFIPIPSTQCGEPPPSYDDDYSNDERRPQNSETVTTNSNR